MSDTNRDIFIALIDAGLDESTILSFIDGASVDASAIVEALGTDANLAELVWQLRADRQALTQASAPTVSLAETEAMVEAVLDQELISEIDADDLAAIEQTGRSDADVRKPTHPPVKVRRVRRVPNRPRRITIALASAALVVLVLSIALPRLDFSLPGQPQSNDTIADAHDGRDAPIRLAQDGSPELSPETDNATNQRTLAGGPTILSRPLEQPVMVETAAEALELAREGRLIVRLVSSREASTARADALLTGQSELSRFATIDGRVDDDAALAFGEALPTISAPVMASDDHEQTGPRRTQREQQGAYMLRVEPSERAFTLLIAKLRSEQGVAVELIGATRPVTTPASAKDLTSLADEPASWRSRISVPVVVEAIK